MRYALMIAAGLMLAGCNPSKAPSAAAPAAIAPTAAPAATLAADPVAAIQPLYVPYLKDGQNPPDWRTAVPWAAATRALIDKEAAATAKTGEVGAIDDDAIVAAQDWKISNLKVSLKSPPSDGRAVVEAVFDNLGKSTTVDWDMVSEEGGWKVDNVHEPEVDLVKLLRESLKQ